MAAFLPGTTGEVILSDWDKMLGKICGMQQEVREHPSRLSVWMYMLTCLYLLMKVPTESKHLAAHSVSEVKADVAVCTAVIFLISVQNNRTTVVNIPPLLFLWSALFINDSGRVVSLKWACCSCILCWPSVGYNNLRLSRNNAPEHLSIVGAIIRV